MDPVIVSVIGVGISLAALMLSGLGNIRSELRSLSERVNGLDQRLSRLEGAFSVAFGLPRPPEYPEPNRDRSP